MTYYYGYVNTSKRTRVCIIIAYTTPRVIVQTKN